MRDYTEYNKKMEQQKLVDWIRTKLINAEESGFTNDTKEEILERAKNESTNFIIKEGRKPNFNKS